MFNQINFAKSSKGKLKNSYGYSLIEVLVALSLVALLLLFTMQSYQHIKATLEARMVLSRLINLINYARSEAIRMGHKIIICKSRDGYNCCGNWSDGQIVFTPIPKRQVLLAFAAINYGKLNFRAFQSSDFLQFMPNGTTFEQNGSFTYCINHIQQPTWMLIVEKSGRIRMA